MLNDKRIVLSHVALLTSPHLFSLTLFAVPLYFSTDTYVATPPSYLSLFHLCLPYLSLKTPLHPIKLHLSLKTTPLYHSVSTSILYLLSISLHLSIPRFYAYLLVLPNSLKCAVSISPPCNSPPSTTSLSTASLALTHIFLSTSISIFLSSISRHTSSIPFTAFQTFPYPINKLPPPHGFFLPRCGVFFFFFLHFYCSSPPGYT